MLFAREYFFLVDLSSKSSSNSLVYLSSPSHSSHHLLCFSSFAEGNLKIPIPLVLRQGPHPNTAQFTPGMLQNKFLAKY